ncbi:MAG: prephenate dehydratase [Candidatus Nanopelagicales bacterium]
MSEQSPPHYGYLGPEGTFSEAALLDWQGATSSDATPYSSVIGALDAVRSGEIAGAMVPMENSVEGSVSATLDSLANGSPLTILAEAQVQVSFSLLARGGTQLSDVRHVTTHPHAEAQCRKWLAKHLPDAQFASAASTAAAAASVATNSNHFDAAIAAPLAGQVYGLQALADDIGDSAAVTRFVLVGPPTAPSPSSGADKTSLVLFIGEDHPGALLEILTEFAVRGVNLTRIESRPTGGGIGDYFFCIDIEGHVDDARVGEALMGLRRVCAEVRFLGSYPRVDQVTPTVRRAVADEQFRDAQAWLARVREGRG